MPTVTIIDYGGGNIGSITRAFERLGTDHVVTADPGTIAVADPLCLPGVGHFGQAMTRLWQQQLAEPIQAAVREGRRFLGICVGMQVLFQESDEAPGVRGLGLVPGVVRRFDAPKVPQIGWNRVERIADIPDLPGTPEAGFAYFVNSFHCVPDDNADCAMISDYHGRFCAGIARGRLTALQFHPEKSGRYGLDLLKRWTNALQADHSVSGH